MNLYESIKSNLNESVKVGPTYKLGTEDYITSYNDIRLDEIGIILEDIELFKRVDTSESAPDKVNYLLYISMRWDGDNTISVPISYNISDNEYEEEINPPMLGIYDEDLDSEVYNTVDEIVRNLALKISQSGRMNESEEDNTLDKVRDTANDFIEYLRKNQISAELLDYNYDEPYGTISYEIEWGDWKHDHIYSEQLVKEFFNGSGNVTIDKEVTEEDGSDTYSAIHNIGFNLDSYLKLNEAANPANEEKNKIIRDALKGPKSYNKNLKALQKMGINKNSKEMEEDDYGQTIYLHGPNGKHISVDPDGTNAWRTFGTRDEDHYKKELDFKNRNSNNYNNQEHLDFSGKRAKDFDYYNYLHKPENEYQEEVDKANKVKDYRDNKDKSGYNLPDEALTPEEKSLNKRPRKYVQLFKDKKELEDELAGYDETKKQLDKVNKEMKDLHK